MQQVFRERLQDLCAVDGTQREIPGRSSVDVETRAAPVVPVERSGTLNRIPEIRRHPDTEITGCDVVVRCNNDWLVDVLGRIMEDLPAAIVLNA